MAQAFYGKALAPLEYKSNMEFDEAAGCNDGRNTDFRIRRQDAVAPAHRMSTGTPK